MKFLAVFSAVLAVACASNTWTLQMLSDATSSPNTDPALVPYLEAALNDMMAAIWAGETVETVTVTIPSVDVSSMTINELSEALQNPNTDPALLPVLETALNELMESMWTGTPVSTVTVASPAMEIHYYTLNDLSAALQDSTTNPALIPYLEHALNEMMSALFDGQQMTFTVLTVPAGLTPVVPAESEVVPVMPVMPEVPEVPVSPVEAPAAPASPSSPLVQIIVNINQQQEVAVVPVAPVAAAEEIAASPVIVVDNAPVSPVQVVDNAPVSPVQVVDNAPVSPIQVVDAAPITPVQVAEPILVDPIQVVETAPVAAEPIIVAQPIFSH